MFRGREATSRESHGTGVFSNEHLLIGHSRDPLGSGHFTSAFVMTRYLRQLLSLEDAPEPLAAAAWVLWQVFARWSCLLPAAQDSWKPRRRSPGKRTRL